MNNKDKQYGKWLLPTLLALAVLAGLYFFLLFPKETATAVIEYLTYIVIILLILVGSFLGYAVYRKQDNSQVLALREDSGKKKKAIEQLIWRNRYVLQSKKAQIMFDDTYENREQWNMEKTNFARKFIFPVIPESEVSIDVVSELIEKSLRGASLGGIRPPTYHVKDEHH